MGVNEFMKEIQIINELNKIFHPPLNIVSIYKEAKKQFCVLKMESLEDIYRIKAEKNLTLKNRIIKIKPANLKPRQLKREKLVETVMQASSENRNKHKDLNNKLEESLQRPESLQETVELVRKKIAGFADTPYSVIIYKIFFCVYEK